MTTSKLISQSFTEFLSTANKSRESVRQDLVDNYMAERAMFPIIEDTFAHFIFKCDGSNPHLAGDFTGWDHTIAPMKNILGTNWWYLTKSFEQNARLDYQFVYNDSIWTLDPLNPRKVLGGFGYKSELRMPDYVPPSEVKYVQDNLHGTLIDTAWYSKDLGNSRNIQVYLPPEYDKTTRDYPLVLVHDGSDYISFANMNNILDNLISDGKIQPIIAVFVPPFDRAEEYVDYKKEIFTQFVINNIIKWVDTEYRTNKDPKHRMVMGSSFGGNISLWFAKEHPNIFA